MKNLTNWFEGLSIIHPKNLQILWSLMLLITFGNIHYTQSKIPFIRNHIKILYDRTQWLPSCPIISSATMTYLWLIFPRDQNLIGTFHLINYQMVRRSIKNRARNAQNRHLFNNFVAMRLSLYHNIISSNMKYSICLL